MADYKDIGTCLSSCILLVLLIHNTAASSLHRAKFCQLYGLGGTADVEKSNTLDQCNNKCHMQTMPPCEKALFYGGLGCCVYYSSEALYEMACNTLATNGFKALHVSGCGAREPTLLMLQKITPPSAKTTPKFTTTTTTTTPAPAAAGEEDGTTASMTTEFADDQGLDEIEDPLDPDRCEEVVLTKVHPAWRNLQVELRNQSAHYFCHKVCLGPLPPKYPWLKPIQEKETCKAWGSYDSSLCASFLDNIVRTWDENKDGQLTLTLCSHAPIPDDMTTADTVTGVTTA